MNLSQNILRLVSRCKVSLTLLFRGDLKTIYKRMRAILMPYAMPSLIIEDIKPNIRIKKEPIFSQQNETQVGHKVLVVDQNFKRYGSHISLSEIIIPLQKQLHENQIEMQLACLERVGDLSSKYTQLFKVQKLLQFPTHMSLAEHYEKEVHTLAEELKSFAPNMVYANSVDMFPVIDAAQIANIKSIWNIREAQDWRLRFADRHPDIIARALACFSYPEKVIFVSETSARTWQEYTDSLKTTVIKTAIAPTAFQNANLTSAKKLRLKLGIPKDGVMLLTVGTLCRDKGQLDGARAITTLPTSVRNKIHWVFIGKSEAAYVKKLKKIWPKDHAEKNLHFGGHVIDCVPYYFAANALVSCSRTEAMPRNILEGIMAGLPIISTDIAASREAVGSYSDSMFYGLGDLEALARYIKSVTPEGIMPTIRNLDNAYRSYEAMLNEYNDHIKTSVKA